MVRRGDSLDEGTGQDPGSLPFLTRLVGRTVRRFVATADGAAALYLVGGVEVTVAPGDEYESWNFGGSNGRFLVGGMQGQFHSWD